MSGLEIMKVFELVLTVIAELFGFCDLHSLSPNPLMKAMFRISSFLPRQLRPASQSYLRSVILTTISLLSMLSTLVPSTLAFLRQFP
ncbi:hypothetical protein V3C99_007926 [Haemonchus contortus]|uniref:Secreted protein n=1 Tax=Haemonchus contortus TaxID=6289 RepID=A0A7I4YPT5_HAECO